MARLIGIVREEVKQLIATLIFISIWHNDPEYHEVVRESLLFLSNSTGWDARKHCPCVVTARQASMGGSGSCKHPCRKLSPRSATPKFLFLRKTCSARSFSGSDSQPQCFSSLEDWILFIFSGSSNICCCYTTVRYPVAGERRQEKYADFLIKTTTASCHFCVLTDVSKWWGKYKNIFNTIKNTEWATWHCAVYLKSV